MKKQGLVMLVILLLAALACQFLPATPAPPPPAPPTSTVAPPSPTAEPTLTPTITPTPVLNSAFGPPLISIHMFTPRNGWGVIENQLLLTNDGGVTWYGVPVPGDVPFNGYAGMYFQNETSMFVLLPNPTGGGNLFYTNTSGQTWQTVPVPPERAWVQFFPMTNLEGFLMTEVGVGAGSMPVAFHQTFDMVTWKEMFRHQPGQDYENSLPIAGIKNGMIFVDPYTGWVTGSVARENFIYFYVTSSSGLEWRPVELEIPTKYGAFMSTTTPPLFPTRSDGFLSVGVFPADGSDSLRLFYVTHDGGATWTLASELPYGVAEEFIDANTGWAWGGKRLYFTADGASTWTLLPVALSPREEVNQIDFIDALNGWIITVDDRSKVRLYRTYDGGNTWTAIIP